MDTEELDILDILAYNSDKLLNEFANLENNENEQNQLIQSYLNKNAQSKIEAVGDFEKDLDWFNVTEPINIAELKGKIVILDFFTYCCINCMHILPDLKSIEDSFPVENGVVVIGVHSAKFDNEKDSSNLLSAIQRYNITHPIVNDSTSSMWTKLKIKCWPTLFLISPTGYPLLVLMGEGHGQFLKRFIAAAIDFYGASDDLDGSALPISPSTNLTSASNLRFPSKICCRTKTADQCELIAISDSGNHRILVLNSNGHVLEKIGGFKSGFRDGDFNTARFNSPQGLAFINSDELVVADTENHAIRKICFRERLVSTIAGTGEQGNDKIGGLAGQKQKLSSPWDVVSFKTRDMDMSFHVDEKSVHEKNVILIAMAGTHQIWGIFLDGIIWWKFKKYEPLTCAALIGNGSEENRNNSYPQNAAFAQPSGMSLMKDVLFIADSESSSIRKASMIDGKVTAVVGGDRNPLNLFAFGDNDGKQYSAKLQHPLAVAYNNIDGYLYVADTYNHKIKRVDVTTNVIETCPIREKDNNKELFQFNEPGGLCVGSSGKLLYIADTNNHTIQIVDLETMLTWPLHIKFNLNCNDEPRGEPITTLEKTIRVSKKCELVLECILSLKNGAKLTESAPQKWKLILPDSGYSTESASGQITDGKFNISININKSDGSLEKCARLHCQLNICSGSICMRREFVTILNFVQDSDVNRKVCENLMFCISPDDVRLL
ncbi:NHL repeat-containing protein 2 [Episyrphus balteatus]|uniref:NHL repeat-containing protein 2 n=1 Tax=Episyrphus balteatus TaxID=286459 RepID=UPI00248653A2|nr:NHL repeat-containing protein 2 [Episyrphus balteatus]